MGGVSFFPFIGPIVAGLYILFRDGLELDFMDKRSVGKKLMKLRPVRLDGQPLGPTTSVKRNLSLFLGWVGPVFLNPFYPAGPLFYLVAHHTSSLGLFLVSSVSFDAIFTGYRFMHIGPTGKDSSVVYFVLLALLLVWTILVSAGFLLGITELVLVLVDRQGRRLGDRWAKTKVIEVADEKAGPKARF